MTARSLIDQKFEGWAAGELFGARISGLGLKGPVTATVGNIVRFKLKYDVEQFARVKEVNPDKLQLKVDIEHGQYRGKNRWINLRNCWL